MAGGYPGGGQGTASALLVCLEVPAVWWVRTAEMDHLGEEGGSTETAEQSGEWGMPAEPAS